MNVLSLFDGMSCGQIALDQLGIRVDNYFASEIDSKAIEVVAKNYPNTKQLGDVTNIRYSGNHKIDLLIGGSPCQSFSSLGDGTGLNGKSGLFYEFVRLLNEVKPTYFLLENVVMKKEYQDIISIELGVKPVAINSKHFTGQNRPRLYWTNIPNIDTYEKTEVDGIIKDFSFWEKVEPTPFVLNKVKEMDINSNFINPYNKSSLVSTFPNLTAQGNSQTKSSSVIRLEGNDFYMANLRHWCVLQGVPYEYMQGLSESQGKTLLGNGWTVDVIKHIFKNLK